MEQIEEILAKLKDCRGIIAGGLVLTEEGLREKDAQLAGWDMAAAVVASFKK